jgi:hypothetical protein
VCGRARTLPERLAGPANEPGDNSPLNPDELLAEWRDRSPDGAAFDTRLGPVVGFATRRLDRLDLSTDGSAARGRSRAAKGTRRRCPLTATDSRTPRCSAGSADSRGPRSGSASPPNSPVCSCWSERPTPRVEGANTVRTLKPVW